MIGVNRVALLGNLGADPETKKTASGQSITLFNLATSNTWTNRDGQRQEHTEWHRIVVWSKLAETCAEYLSKGRKVYVEGRLQTRSWEDDKGQKRYTTEIVASQVLFLDRGVSQEKRGATDTPQTYTNEPTFGGDKSPSTGSGSSSTANDSSSKDTTTDDLPF